MNSATKRSSRGPLLKLTDYARIHSVTRAVLDGVEGRTLEGCVFFSLVGSYLLEKFHKVSARPMAGAAFYGLGGSPPSVLSYGRLDGDDITSDAKAFHCWVECEGWAIDFMAPIFPELGVKQELPVAIPCKMFQRPLAEMATELDGMAAGDFAFLPNPALTLELIASSLAKPAAGDLANICADWYRPAPKKIQAEKVIGSDDGSVRRLRLRVVPVIGAW